MPTFIKMAILILYQKLRRILTLNRVDRNFRLPAMSHRLSDEFCCCICMFEALSFTLAVIQIHIDFAPTVDRKIGIEFPQELIAKLTEA